MSESTVRRPAASTLRVAGFTGFLTLAGIVVAATTLRHLGPLPTPFAIPWWALTLAFALSEIMVIHLPFKRDAHSISLSELPLILGLFFVSPLTLVAARIAGAGTTLAMHRKQRGIKLAFNLATFVFEAPVAVAVFRSLLGDASGLSARAWFAAGFSVLIIDVLGALSVTTVISLHEGRLQRAMLPHVLASGMIAAIINTTLGVLAASTLWANRAAAWLLLVISLVLYAGYRGYASLSQRYLNLQQLYEFTRTVGRANTVEASLNEMLSRIRELLRAEHAQIMISSIDEGHEVLSVGVGTQEETGMARRGALEPGSVWATVIDEDRPILAARGSRDGVTRALLEQAAVRDMIVVPLKDRAGVIGTLTVANRLDAVSTFDDDDQKLLETLGNHVGTVIEHGRLIDRLRAEAAEKEHQAHHDALTGLGNRTLFHKRVHAAIARAAAGRRPLAVMLMDLNRFKEVNDTLGHHHGDVLLQEVARRLQSSVGVDATIARLGGDEFAILLTDVAGSDGARETALEILAALQRPFELEDMTLDIGASIGIAMFPEHGDQADSLLQRADVAMYSAKASGHGTELYDPERDQYSPRRLTLIGDLRRALEARELTLHYQPKVDLRSGRVIGVEALVRWRHPQFGFVDPEEFVYLAEQSGLMQPLTEFVLEAALQQCAEWQREGLNIGMAVNISARNMLDSSLPDDIRELLTRSGVPATSLTLELTETTIMADVSRTIGVLDRLSGMGIRLAVDDFGTGYSSLSYLKRLPVTEVKIDKSFVFNMNTDANDAAIVSSIIDLGANLGMTIVAEGIEDEETMKHLIQLGCHQGQGYYLSRPLPATHVRRWMAERALSLTAAAPAPAKPALRAVGGTALRG